MLIQLFNLVMSACEIVFYAIGTAIAVSCVIRITNKQYRKANWEE